MGTAVNSNSWVPSSGIELSEAGLSFQYYCDCLINLGGGENGLGRPLRQIRPLVSGSVPLQYAIMFLVAQHRQYPREKRLNFKGRALTAFRKDLSRADDVVKLGVILILLFAEAVDSGIGPWRIHLLAVRGIMEAQHSMKSLKKPWNSIEIDLYLQFYWWDTIGALLSMQKPVLPPKALEALLDQGKPKGSRYEDCQHEQLLPCSKAMFLRLVEVAHGDAPEIGKPPVTSKSNVIAHQRASFDSKVDSLWYHALATYGVTAYPPYRVGRATFDYHAGQVFDLARDLVDDPRLRHRIMFPLLVSGSCTDDPKRRDFFQWYCESSFEETRFGYFNLGLTIAKNVEQLRSDERSSRKNYAGAAYSCWRNLTATEDAEHAMLG
ncbi:uncharacterized protein KY384_001349 [Bacidia gigantensis]|uniref:uncharacterized protein n=1 Tax=Bacidia gigantensis TaxID=2732470 RepID=UPI001D03F7DD|nr:uncharacterized protein KY384_001349 [Bacidia gigantensis]KAG8533609.1 hypothetical protein KY384_001349 [Bacidia gigantensis]